MPVSQAKDGTRVKRDHVYVIPPDKNMQMVRRTLRLFEKPERPYIAHSINLFFRSMAENLRDKAIGIVLSGEGDDGAFGARLINRRLGIVGVQEPSTAKSPGMPRSIIDAGVADFVLPPSKMPRYLINWSKEYYGKPAREREKILEKRTGLLKKVFELVKTRTGHDLSIYKRSTVYRRVQRRMEITHSPRIQDYIRLLREDSHEIDTILRELIIRSTSFFTDPESLSTLKKHLKRLIRQRKPGTEIRVWTIGCSTGEESYSTAFLIQECINELKMPFGLKIFATDLDKTAINLARNGFYPSSILRDEIDARRIERFFNKKGTYYQVKKEIRKKILFSELDFVKAPSFLHIDLITPRNIFIYLNSEAQKKLIPIFHSTLNPGGILFLGTRDSMGRYAELFEPLDTKGEIYKRRDQSQSQE